MSLVLDYSKVDSIAKKITFKLCDEKGHSELISFQQAASYCFDANVVDVAGIWISPREIFSSNGTKNVLITPITLIKDKTLSSNASHSHTGTKNGKHENDIVGVRYTSVDGDCRIEISALAKRRKKSWTSLIRKPSFRGKSESEESWEKSSMGEFQPSCGLHYSAQLRTLEAVE
jgi:hypothetical protein